MAIEKEAVLILLRQILIAKPKLGELIKSSREVLFTLLARIYVFDEMRRELQFEREEIEELFSLLLSPEFALCSSPRLEKFLQQIMKSSEQLVQDQAFRQAVALALIEAVKARAGSD